MSFEMALNNFQFDFEQFKSPAAKVFEDYRHPDINYFDGINIPCKETTCVN